MHEKKEQIAPMMAQIIQLRKKYDLHIKAEQYISDEAFGGKIPRVIKLTKYRRHERYD